MTTTSARDEAEPDLGLAQPSGPGRHANVAGERQLAAAAQREAVDHRDRRERTLGDHIEQARRVHRRALLERGAVGELADVRARDERPVARAREDHDARLGRDRDVGERGLDVRAHAGAERVALLGSVDGERGDTVLDRHADVLVAHSLRSVAGHASLQS
jgi:hypothetical protein